jgi:hypothetical protein
MSTMVKKGKGRAIYSEGSFLGGRDQMLGFDSTSAEGSERDGHLQIVGSD